MSFKDLNALNKHLVDKSYIEGFAYSEKDLAVFKSFPLPDAKQQPHAYRWYIHIAALTGLPAAMVAMAPAAAAPAAQKGGKKQEKKAEEDDDDMDLFGDDDDEEEAAPTKSRAQQAAELKAKRDAEADERKAAALARLAKKEANQRSLCNLEIKPWEAEQDLMELFNKIKTTVVKDGLKWSENCALKDVAFGIKKIILTAVISQSLSMDAIIEEITEELFADEVQSMEMTSMSLL